MDSLKDLMQKRANGLDVDSKRDELAIAQEVITHQFPHDVTVLKIFPDGGILLSVDNAPLASDVRMRAPALIQSLNAMLKNTEITKIRTKIV